MSKRLIAAFVGWSCCCWAPGTSNTVDPCTLLGCGDDLTWAQNLEHKVQQNTRERSGLRDRQGPDDGAITSINHFGDSALWTGTYLAAESYRYALASKYLAGKLTKDDRAFWTAQQTDAKPRIDAMVAKFHLLANISKNWTNNNPPTVAPPAINLGGTVYKGGEAGNLFRACLPTDTPEATAGATTRSRRAVASTDHSTGTTEAVLLRRRDESRRVRRHVLRTAHGLRSRRSTDKHIADTIRDDIATMVGFAVKYYWNTPRPNGRISIPIGAITTARRARRSIPSSTSADTISRTSTRRCSSRRPPRD